MAWMSPEKPKMSGRKKKAEAVKEQAWVGSYENAFGGGTAKTPSFANAYAVHSPVPSGPGAGGAQDNWIVNKRFNRIESALDHYYYSKYGSEPHQDHVTEGMIKCKLLHGQGYSLVIPDQLYVEHHGLKWIQPLAFARNQNTKFSEEEILCDLPIDISCGHTVRVRFFNRNLISNLPDGSQLYTCELRGPTGLHEYATGEAERNAEGTPYLRLHHHTTAETCPKIVASGYFRTGSYNIQGTAKQLKNVAYAYFTPLDAIKNDNDLKKIAMANGGKIEFRRDGFTPPTVLMPNYLETFKDDILQLDVYPCDPAKREACIDVWVDSTVLAPQHIYYHHDGPAVYYEFSHYFIHRIGTDPRQNVSFDGNRRIHRQPGLRSFDYIVVGDCTTLAGLAAPYDEEDTTHIMKVERLPDNESMLSFWFEHGNQDLYSAKRIEMQQFHPRVGGAGGKATT